MDITSFIEIAVVIVIIYLFIKFIVNPIIRIIVGVITFLVIIYLLQRFFGFDIDKTFGPFGKYLDINNLGPTLNWVLGPINYYIDQVKAFLHFIGQGLPKSTN